MTTEVFVHALSTLRRGMRLLIALPLAVALTVPVVGLATTQAAAAGGQQTCDIDASGGTPCVAAYSTTRALFASYNGPLYQIQRVSDSSKLNIGLKSAGGVVNSAPQVSFCSGTTCTITQLYDQTANGNNLPISPGTTCSG